MIEFIMMKKHFNSPIFILYLIFWEICRFDGYIKVGGVYEQSQQTV